MTEILKENWFVVVIAVLMISFVGYFIYDSTKYEVSNKKVDGKDVLASIEGKDVTADDLYEESKAFDSALLYNMYRNAVVDQTIKTTEDLEKEAKNLENTIRSSSTSTEDFEETITKELAGYGFESYDDLFEYCLTSVKEKEMNRSYVNDHFEELSKALEEKKPRVISILSMAVANPDDLTEVEQKKKDSIEKSLEDDNFGKTAESFSEDTSTASNKGLYGYIDTDDAANTQGTLDSSVVDAALALDKGQTSDWITVSDQNSGTTYLYKVHIDETDVNAINKNKNKDIADQLLYAILQNNKGLATTILEENASKLEVEIKDEDVKKKLDKYIKQQKGEE